MKFTKQELREEFNGAYYSRGLAYFKQKKVHDLDVIDDTQERVVFEATTDGSGRKLYTQTVTIHANEKEYGIIVKGYCSCPMDYNCKHIVAVCLQYQDDVESGKIIGNNSLLWLNTFAESFEEEQENHNSTQNFLLYVLKKDPHSKQMQLYFHITKILKNGGLAKGSTESFESVCHAIYYRAAYLQEADIEIIGLLQAGNERFAKTCLIQGSASFLAVKQMLATGRCFWEGFHNSPLRLSEARTFFHQWVYDDLGNAQLHLEVQPEAFLLPTEPAMYVDVHSQEIGTLNDMPYNTKQLQMLMEAPVVPASLVDEFSQRTAMSVPKAILAPPKEIETKIINNQAPVPHVWLHVMDMPDGRLRLGRLRFSYADYELSVLPEGEQRNLMQDNLLLTIDRDLPKEDGFMKALDVMGFSNGVTEEQSDLYFFFPSNNELEDNGLWSGFINNHVPTLQGDGWNIEVSDDFNMQFHEAEDWHADIEEQGNDWFDLRFDMEINGKKQALLPLIAQVLKHYEPDGLPEILTLDLGHGQYLNLPSEQVKPVLDILYELYDHKSLSEDGALKMSRFDAGRLADLEHENSNLQWRGGENLRQIGKQLKDFEGIQVVPPPQGLQAELRHYQQQGLNWLQFLRCYQFNGILADDMGLGKTVQTLAHLLVEKEQGRLDRPCLIVAPTSLMSNWRREAAAFAPELTVLVLQGSERRQHFDHIDEYDVVLSTYPLLVRDEDVLMKHEFHMLVLDEAQVVKNPKAKAAKVVRQLKARHKLCLTGTPMENHLGELWALFDFLMPGFLGDAKQFNSMFRTPIEKYGDSEQQQRLVQRIKPFMLRRSKSEVASELPEKTEIIRTVSLGKKQAALYESIRISMEKKVRDTIADKGLARSHITILDALLKLRQVCCDPRILSLKQAKKLEESAKLELLMQMLPEMLEEGRRILLFSQFTKMLALIEDELKSRNIRYSKLTGQTRKRDDAIEMFKRGEADVFLISLKAGGVGLNLTEADTVIHYDPWWNPAAEHQATDRAHRIGQDKAVFVYKLVVENSVEEKIIAMQAKKQALADAVYQQGTKQDELKITSSDMQALFAPL